MPFQKEPESASYRKTYSESEVRIDGRIIKKGDPVFELLCEIRRRYAGFPGTKSGK